MSFFLFVTITSWLLVIAWFVLFTFNLHTKINLNINWNITVKDFFFFIKLQSIEGLENQFTEKEARVQTLLKIYLKPVK